MSKFQALLGDGQQFGIHLQYAVQPKPEGMHRLSWWARLLSAITPAPGAGRHIFYGHDLAKDLRKLPLRTWGAYLPILFTIQNATECGI